MPFTQILDEEDLANDFIEPFKTGDFMKDQTFD